MLAAFYVYNPAVFINSALWGQVDSFFTLIVISAAVMLSERKVAASAALFAAAVMMKLQGIIFLPVLFFELAGQRRADVIFKAAACALGTAAAVALPFSLNNGTLWIFKLFTSTAAEYPYSSVNAFNFFK